MFSVIAIPVSPRSVSVIDLVELYGLDQGISRSGPTGFKIRGSEEKGAGYLSQWLQNKHANGWISTRAGLCFSRRSNLLDGTRLAAGWGSGHS